MYYTHTLMENDFMWDVEKRCNHGAMTCNNIQYLLVCLIIRYILNYSCLAQFLESTKSKVHFYSRRSKCIYVKQWLKQLDAINQLPSNFFFNVNNKTTIKTNPADTEHGVEPFFYMYMHYLWNRYACWLRIFVEAAIIFLGCQELMLMMWRNAQVVQCNVLWEFYWVRSEEGREVVCFKYLFSSINKFETFTIVSLIFRNRISS